MAEATYRSDVAFLSQHTDVIELHGSGDARVAVAPAYQGRVMTSTLAADSGASFGWIHRDFIASGRTDPQFNNYGGEDRFWLGPEAGQYGLWFSEGEPFDMRHWRTPAGFDTGSFRVTSRGHGSVALATQFEVANFSGARFDCAVSRTLDVLSWDHAAEMLGATVPAGVAMVAFASTNTLANAGNAPWTKDGGLLSLWILGQFKPLPRGKVIVPFNRGAEEDLGPVATTDYFGPLPPDRCRIADTHLLFACDGKYRSKIGISPRRAKPVLGSYDPDGRVLTVVQFNLPAAADQLPYVNSLWQIQDQPFAGDVVNSYNDGEEKPGAGQLGPFYEIETSSPAAELNPGESITHIHRTFHFAGDPEALNGFARRVLGVDLEEISR